MKKRLSNFSVVLILALLLVLERIVDLANSEGSFTAAAMDWTMETLLTLPAILIGISFHEFAHAKVSQLLGDPTPEAHGRVSLSPTAHIDPIGFLSLTFLGFGWGRPVPIESLYYKNIRRGEILVGLAGVTMNLFIAMVVGIVIKIMLVTVPIFCIGTMGGILLYILMKICWINLVLMAFNLIPCPPLDGFNVLANVIGFREREIYHTIYNKGLMVLILLVVFNIPSRLITMPLMFFADFLYGTVMKLPWVYLLLASPV